jgi:hypothetical protein
MYSGPLVAIEIKQRGRISFALPFRELSAKNAALTVTADLSISSRRLVMTWCPPLAILPSNSPG